MAVKLEANLDRKPQLQCIPQKSLCKIETVLQRAGAPASQGTGSFVKIYFLNGQYHKCLLTAFHVFDKSPPHHSCTITIIDPPNGPFRYNLLNVATFNPEWADDELDYVCFPIKTGASLNNEVHF